jgi:hypothetical protein
MAGAAGGIAYGVSAGASDPGTKATARRVGNVGLLTGGALGVAALASYGDQRLRPPSRAALLVGMKATVAIQAGEQRQEIEQKDEARIVLAHDEASQARGHTLPKGSERRRALNGLFTNIAARIEDTLDNGPGRGGGVRPVP